MVAKKKDRKRAAMSKVTEPPRHPRVGIIMGSRSDLGVMRLGAAILDEMGIDFELLRGEITSDGAIYSERADFLGMPFEHQQTYTLTSTEAGATAVRFEVNWGDEPIPPDEMKQQFVGGCAASFEVLKGLLEDRKPDESVLQSFERARTAGAVFQGG